MAKKGNYGNMRETGLGELQIVCNCEVLYYTTASTDRLDRILFLANSMAIRIMYYSIMARATTRVSVFLETLYASADCLQPCKLHPACSIQKAVDDNEIKTATNSLSPFLSFDKLVVISKRPIYVR